MIARMTSLLLATVLFCASAAAQGKFAGTHKNVLGKKYTDEKSIPWLKGYTWRQGDLITDANDGRPQFLTIYFKGKDALVLYTAHVDGPAELYVVIDAIEIKNIATDWDIRTAGCSEGSTQGQIIIAIVKAGNKKTTTIVQKAWRCNRDKLRIEAIDAKNIHCVVEDGD
ncbi:MAG: hypothetical protein QM726_05935 [Chitinophagaceae bacterium]